MRLALSRCVVSVGLSLVVACGGGGSNTQTGSDALVDAPGQDIGFAKPTKSVKANMEQSLDVWTELGSADFSCLGTPSADVATTVAVALSTTTQDFQTMDVQPTVVVTAFQDVDIGSAFDMQTSDGSGDVTITIPIGTKRFGLKMTNDNDLDTFLLNQKVDPSTATQTTTQASQIISKETGATLPALIGETRTAGTGVAAGALRDCGVHEVSNFVATVSSTQGTATPIPGAASYYFSSTVGLPVHHNQEAAATNDGLFMSIQLPVTTTAYVQAWGYLTDADLASDKLTLLSELTVPVLADTVITGSFEAIRQ
jgi:hypothetical protein